MWVKLLQCTQSVRSRCAHDLHTGCAVSLLQAPMPWCTDRALLPRSPCNLYPTYACCATVYYLVTCTCPMQDPACSLSTPPCIRASSSAQGSSSRRAAHCQSSGTWGGARRKERVGAG